MKREGVTPWQNTLRFPYVDITILCVFSTPWQSNSIKLSLLSTSILVILHLLPNKCDDDEHWDNLSCGFFSSFKEFLFINTSGAKNWKNSPALKKTKPFAIFMNLSHSLNTSLIKFYFHYTFDAFDILLCQVVEI